VGLFVAILLVATLAADPQNQGVDPAILQIRILEGEGAIYRIGSRATRGITILVSDETGKPVEGARVSFRLPESGPTGTFHTGAHTEIATTRADGRAAIWGMQWNRVTGPLEVRVTAEKGQTRAGTVCALYLSDAPEAASQPARIGGGPSHKWIWIAAAIGGAAAAGIAATAARGTPTATAATPTVTIGTPTITLGHP